MCGGGPSAPDPVATANAQGGVNRETAVAQANLNRIDQYSPFGSSTYSIRGYNADGTPQYVQNTSLSPQMQGLLDSQLNQDQRLTGLGSSLIDQAQTNMSTPVTNSMQLQGGMSPDQFAAWQGGFQNTAGPAAQAGSTGYNAAQTGSTGYNAAQAGSTGYNAAQAGSTGYNAAQAGSTGYNAAQAGYRGAGPSATAYGASAAAGGAAPTATHASGWDIQRGLQGAGDLQGQFNVARDAALQSQMGYLQPQFNQQSQQTQDQLRQQGITQSSNPQAYQNAMDQLNRDQTFQRQQAYDSSFNTGLASANQLFNQSLQSGQFGNAAQQQGFAQSAWNAGQANQLGMANATNQTNANIATAGNQTNAGIASMNAANAQNQFNAQAFNNAALQNAAFANTAGQFGAGAANTAALSNQAAANQASQFGAAGSNTAALSNQAAANQASQFGAAGSNTAALANQAAANQASQFGAAGSNIAALANQAAANQAGQFGANAFNTAALQNALMANQQGQFNAGLNNAAQQSVMQGYLGNAGMQNQASGQNLSQLFAMRNQPLNELSSLRGMTPIQTPQFGNVSQVGMQSPDLMGAIQNNYNAQLASYNNQQSGLFGLGGAAITGMMMSDRRLKRDIRRLGVRHDGIGIYSFRYLWDDADAPARVGVMAQEVERVLPHAVLTMADGFKAVNYAAL